MKSTNPIGAAKAAGALSVAKDLTAGLARFAKSRWDAMAPADRAKVAASAFGPLGAMFGPRKSLASRVLGVGGVFGAGVLVGAATAAMLTPKRGEELREALMARIRELGAQPGAEKESPEHDERAARDESDSEAREAERPSVAARSKKSNGSSKTRVASA